MVWGVLCRHWSGTGDWGRWLRHLGMHSGRLPGGGSLRGEKVRRAFKAGEGAETVLKVKEFILLLES